MPGKLNRTERLHDHLNVALDGLLAALAEAGGLPQVAPEEGLDVALTTDEAFQEARVRFSEALKKLLAEGPGGSPSPQVMEVEEMANAMVARSTEVGFALGLRVGRGRE